MKPHIFAQMVNEVRDLARQYGQVEQFRCRVADLLGKYIPVEHNLKGMPEQTEAQAVMVPEPTHDEFMALAESSRIHGDLVDFMAGAAAYGLWLRGKIRAIPADRVLGEGMVQVDREAITAIEIYIAGKRIVQPTHQEFIDRNFVLDEIRSMVRALRANQGGADHG